MKKQTPQEKIAEMEKTVDRLGKDHPTSKFLMRVVTAIKKEEGG